MATILEMTVDPILARYNTDAFRNAVEDHVELWRSNSKTAILEISDGEALACAGDFYYILAKNNIPKYLWWVILRVNHMVSPHDYDGTQVRFLMPDEDTVTRLSVAVSTQVRAVS
jgi:hypothetical protein